MNDEDLSQIEIVDLASLQSAIADAYSQFRDMAEQGKEGALKIVRWWHCQDDTSSDRTPTGSPLWAFRGETVNPPCNRKSRTGNPSPTAGRARSLSQPSASFEARSAPRSYPTEG
jgi:hypothetical protein